MSSPLEGTLELLLGLAIVGLLALVALGSWAFVRLVMP